MNMNASYRFVAYGLVMMFVGTSLTACSTAPKSQASRDILQDKARLTVLEQADPSLNSFLRDRSYAYAVFPEIGKGGFIVGGAYGRGVVFRGDDFLGYVELNQGSVGLQAGAKTFSEILAFADGPTLNEVRNRGEFTLGSNISATALKAGAATAVNF